MTVFAALLPISRPYGLAPFDIFEVSSWSP
jgi:hypothetical protein